MIKKSSIYSKIRKKTLLISVISVLSIGAAAFYVILYMRQSVTYTSMKLGDAAASDSKQALVAQTEESLSRLAKNKAVISDEKLSSISNFVEMIAQNAAEIITYPDNYTERQVNFPEASNENTIVSQLRLANGVAYSDVADEIALIGNIQDILVAIKQNNGSIRSAYIGTESGVSISADRDSAEKTNVFDPRERLWYTAAKEENTLIWTDVFDDNSGRGLVITCAKPFYDENNNIYGVAGIGMMLENLNNAVVGTKIGETGYAFIINEKGEIIISDKIKKDGGGNIIRENLFETNKLPLESVKKMINGGSEIERVIIDDTECFLAYEPLSTLPWSLAVVMSVNEVIAPALESERFIITLKNEAINNIDKIILLLTVEIGLIIIITEIVNLFLTKKLSADIASPVIKLSKSAEIIGSGNLEHKLDVKTGDEVETLADTFNLMIDNIKKITADKERISAELNVAAKIQASMLPYIFPPFPERTEFNIFATMLPAKEVGGDFYDFFFVDNTHLGIVIADVSGKGVPAALFMVVAKTLVKNYAQLGLSVSEVFTKTNAKLCEGNDADMFVTAFMGILDIETMIFKYVNAGHNPPCIKKAGNENDYEFMDIDAGFILAGIDSFKYNESQLKLNSGDAIYLYTDGVTEATDINNKLFSETRLIESLNRHKNKNPQNLLKGIKADIDGFVCEAPQFDDITMLAVIIN